MGKRKREREGQKKKKQRKEEEEGGKRDIDLMRFFHFFSRKINRTFTF